MSRNRRAVRDSGRVEVVVSESRHEPFDTGCFTHAGINPARKRYILIKSRQHFCAGFEPIISHVVMVAGRASLRRTTASTPESVYAV